MGRIRVSYHLNSVASLNSPLELKVSISCTYMEISDLRPFVFGGIASIVAESGTFPIDCTKTRLQIQTTRIYKGMIDAGTQIYRKEGAKALYSGILPAILRQAVYGTIKFGSYYSLKEVIANLYPDRVEESLWVNVSCAAFAGSVSSAIANPTDVLKVRMQIHGKGTLGTGLFRCFYDLYLNEGFRGLYRGVGPTSQRAAIIAMVELPVYDYCKHYLLDSFGDHIYNHFISSFIASFGSAVASTPVDVIRTRLMNQKRIIGNQLIGPTAATTIAENQKVYFTSSFECASNIIRNEGLSALYKGFIPTFLRMGPWNIIFFCTYEQLKKL